MVKRLAILAGLLVGCDALLGIKSSLDFPGCGGDSGALCDSFEEGGTNINNWSPTADDGSSLALVPGAGVDGSTGLVAIANDGAATWSIPFGLQSKTGAAAKVQFLVRTHASNLTFFEMRGFPNEAGVIRCDFWLSTDDGGANADLFDTNNNNGNVLVSFAPFGNDWTLVTLDLTATGGDSGSGPDLDVDGSFNATIQKCKGANGTLFIGAIGTGEADFDDFAFLP